MTLPSSPHIGSCDQVHGLDYCTLTSRLSSPFLIYLISNGSSSSPYHTSWSLPPSSFSATRPNMAWLLFSSEDIMSDSGSGPANVVMFRSMMEVLSKNKRTMRSRRAAKMDKLRLNWRPLVPAVKAT
jgi:hypothetical protein